MVQDIPNDIDLPESEPEIYEFDGDINYVSFQDPRPEWENQAKRLKFVVRDWAKTLENMEAGREYPFVHYPAAIGISTSRNSSLSRIRHAAEKHLDVDLKTDLKKALAAFPLGFNGLSAHFRLSPARRGNSDILSIIGPAESTKPQGMPDYTPRESTVDDDEAPDQSSTAGFSVSEEALVEIGNIVGDERDPVKAKGLVAKDRTFKGRFPQAYAAFLGRPDEVLSRL